MVENRRRKYLSLHVFNDKLLAE